ncbi:MAG: protein kinase [Ignavibacteriae bacterium]|nr:protein kinase [Ignavibacteriota bacterium]
MIGLAISHYKILEKLGEGGMGVVFKAEDTKLKRIVALKFLPESVSSSGEELARFQQEAEAISALNHSNIATIYDVDEVEGKKFLALEFIPGGTLKSRIKKLKNEGREISIEEATDYIIQIAEGLGHAHRQQIIHRDIKSDNLMLTDEGKIKITDFGLAKLRGTSTLTKSGSTVGTLAYMAPEQMQGNDVDVRADMFSLGVVFFELLTGKMPFRGEHEAAIMYSVLNEEPQLITNVRPNVPTNLQQIIGKLLQKEPQCRYQSMRELLSDLRNSRQGNPKNSAEQKSIVVLPFENMSPDKENEYFSDGLTEEIISDLSKIQSLRVISRTSAMRLKGSTKDIKTIAQELNVRYVLEGSVRKSGQTLRITAQLIDGKSDANLWAEKYNGTLEDVFEIQENVSRAIVGALKVTLSSDEERRMEERPINNAQAYDLYLKARRELQRGMADSLERSIQLLNQGLAIVGENEILYAALGYVNISYFRWISKVDVNFLHRAREYAQKVFSLNPSSSHGYNLLGLIQMNEGDIVEAIRSMKMALVIEPTNTETLLWLAACYSYVGKNVDAMKAADALIVVDPLTPINIFIKGVVFAYRGDFSEALVWANRAFAMDTQSPLAIWSQAIVLVWCGKYDEAIVLIDELAWNFPAWVYTQHGLFLKHALRGEKHLALQYDTSDLALEAKYDMHFALHVSHCFTLIGEIEKALFFLEHSIRNGMLNYPFLSKYDPLLDNLRGDERFKKLMEQVRVLHEQLTV